jgi:hypothetical protein
MTKNDVNRYFFAEVVCNGGKFFRKASKSLQALVTYVLTYVRRYYYYRTEREKCSVLATSGDSLRDMRDSAFR